MSISVAPSTSAINAMGMGGSTGAAGGLDLGIPEQMGPGGKRRCLEGLIQGVPRPYRNIYPDLDQWTLKETKPIVAVGKNHHLLNRQCFRCCTKKK
jgi:hypothetical protein